MSNETTIKDEFIHVKCKFKNGTKLYEEFHSFIFDKPQVEERCRNANKSQYSVLIVGVDSVSRLNMHRQLNATANYLLNEMEAIEMYGYNKVGDNTFPNLIPLLTGYDERELPAACWKSDHLPLDNCNILWKRFAEKGYRTFYAEDAPYISTFNYVKRGFYHQPTDYYFRPFIMAYEDTLGRNKGLNCYQCVGSTSETEAVLNWAEEFALHFSNRSYFSFSWINSLTHDFLNMGSAGDYMYEDFFRYLHKTGALDKTITILISDHGMRWGAIRNTYVGRLEERLPMLLIALPQKFKQEYPDFARTLRENSHRLVTPFDLHATLRHLLNLTQNWKFENTDDVGEELSHNFTTRAQSLFQPVPSHRSCDDAYIEEHWCTCETSLNVDVKSKQVKQVATFLLGRINKILKPFYDKCARLKLDSILDARLWQAPNEHAGHSVNDDIYTVVIQTNPSKATFEGTVKISKPQIKFNLLGTVSRLNLYGNQSSCIDNAILKKYCYCL